MQLRSVETTPNPNSIKLNFDQVLGTTATYSVSSNSSVSSNFSIDSPDFIKELLKLEGLLSVFVCGDFITLNRDPKVSWQPLLDNAKAVFYGSDASASSVASGTAGGATEINLGPATGENQVLVQTFKGVPIQVKVVDSAGESRLALGERFNSAAQQLQQELGADYLKERTWVDHGVRYGERDTVAAEVQAELLANFAGERLSRATRRALGQENPVEHINLKALLADSEWQKRLVAVQELALVNDLQLLAVALADQNPQVRRLAAAALGAAGDSSAFVVERLCQALVHDSSVAVRRTAGDALSDLAAASAEEAMALALADGNRLVRWRAARFLNDLGGEGSIAALEAASSDDQFEVRLEVEAAIARIKSGERGAGPAWRRIDDLKQDPSKA